MSKEKRLSDCCKSPLKKTNGDELIDFDSNLSKQKVGETYWYVCMKCKNPCDIYSGKPKEYNINPNCPVHNFSGMITATTDKPIETQTPLPENNSITLECICEKKSNPTPKLSPKLKELE